MRNNVAKSRISLFAKNTVLALVMLVLVIATPSSLATSMGPPNWAIYFWRHIDCSSSEGDFDGWCSTCTSRFADDDDGGGDADESSIATFFRSDVFLYWEYYGGDSQIDDDIEFSALLSAVFAGSNGAYVLNSSYLNTPGYSFNTVGRKIVLLFEADQNFGAICLAHELGHVAGLGHVSIFANVMTASDDGAALGVESAADRRRITLAQMLNYEGY